MSLLIKLSLTSHPSLKHSHFSPITRLPFSSHRSIVTLGQFTTLDYSFLLSTREEQLPIWQMGHTAPALNILLSFKAHRPLGDSSSTIVYTPLTTCHASMHQGADAVGCRVKPQNTQISQQGQGTGTAVHLDTSPLDARTRQYAQQLTTANKGQKRAACLACTSPCLPKLIRTLRTHMTPFARFHSVKQSCLLALSVYCDIQMCQQ